MSTTKIQSPRKLTEEEDLDSFEDWWFQVECYYSRDVKFSEFFDDKKLTWKERSEQHRGLTSADQATNLNTLLRALATYTSGPYVKNELLDDTRSLKDVRKIFLRFLEIEVTDLSLLNYYSITRRPSERPLVFYHRLRYHILQHHLPEGTVISPTKTLKSDEVLSTTMERFIIMEWLHRLDIRHSGEVLSRTVSQLHLPPYNGRLLGQELLLSANLLIGFDLQFPYYIIEYILETRIFQPF